MLTELEVQRKILASKTIKVEPLKLLTYPTRLADAFEAKILDVSVAANPIINRPEIEITINQGNTKDLGIKPKNILKRLIKNYTKPLDMGTECVFDTRYEIDTNIAHILMCVAPGLLAAKDMCPKITVILRKNASNLGRKTYESLGCAVICTDREVTGRIIKVPMRNTFIYEGWYGEIFGSLDFEGYEKDTPARVFISRKGARSLINESEVEATLRQYGFTKVYYEDTPIHEQWSITKNAEVIVGIHGAALASLVFNNNRVKVLELFNPGYLSQTYWRMTHAVGGKHCGVTGQITKNVIEELDFKQKARSFASAPTKIDIRSLEMALEYLEVDKQ